MPPKKRRTFRSRETDKEIPPQIPISSNGTQITLLQYLGEITCNNPRCTSCKNKQDTQTTNGGNSRELSPPPHYVSKSKFSKHLFCPICMEVLLHPVRFFCGHVFCAPCVRQLWMKQGETGSRGCCPLDRIEIDWTIAHFDLVAKKFLAGQQVYCPNRKNSCKWEGLKRDEADHIQQCPYKEIPEWLRVMKPDNSKSNLDNFMEDEELAEIMEKEAPDVDLFTRMYFKEQNIFNSTIGAQPKSKGKRGTSSKPNKSGSNTGTSVGKPKQQAEMSNAVNDLLNAFDENEGGFNIDKLLEL